MHFRKYFWSFWFSFNGICLQINWKPTKEFCSWLEYTGSHCLCWVLFVENKYFTHKTFTEAMEKYFQKNISPESFLFVVVVMQLCIRYNMRRIWSEGDCCWSRMHCEICWDASTLHLLASCHHPGRKYLTTTHSRKYLSCWLWKIFEVWQKCWYLSVRHSHACHLAQDDTSIKEEQIISLKM